ncbi:cupin domain-containing protein [Rhodoferax sp. 4810]|uniref:Cupin domain-containing protein n=1 Tax=Thiospirillum jenense TaxID=1653858 RepID=A0A839HD57_9GAMM|nr:cupin domain-containing protein [Thiospirillum jenense]MBB1073857.1 cupin domain-containing protein [Rhodoferax jenense]MBB1125188.1 cupin domain-containing protein [Thiospirillum jenense]
MQNIMYVLLSTMLLTGCASIKPANDIAVVQLIQSTKSWNEQPLPAYKTGTPEITILRITIPPHHALPMHTHPVINAGVLLKGQLTVITDSNQVLHLKPNDPIVEVIDTWHYGKNEGNEPAEIIVFYAGEKGQPITIKQSKK